MINRSIETSSEQHAPSRGFWGDAWTQFRNRKVALAALLFIATLSITAVFSPAIVGTKPIVCRYKNKLYFPCLGYFNRNWENAIFKTKDKFRGVYPRNLTAKDPDHWVLWPMKYQDPYRPVRKDEWKGVEGYDDSADLNRANPRGADGHPSWRNWFGTKQGVDVYAQMVHGTRIALLVGFVSTGLASIIGITMGAIAGYFGGWIDMFLSRLLELVMCIPALVLILAIISILEKPTIWWLMAILGLTGWTGIARLTRAEFLKLKETEFVSSARSIGAGPFRIMFRHIIPNALAPILVPIAFGIAGAILTEAALSLLGFGAPPPNPSWGAILQGGRQNHHYWLLIVFPGTAIFLTVLAYNLLGEGIQESTDPRLREPGK